VDIEDSLTLQCATTYGSLLEKLAFLRGNLRAFPSKKELAFWTHRFVTWQLSVRLNDNTEEYCVRIMSESLHVR
jgi:hypothetical protein